ncbi:MAG: ribosome rescue protein RqcH [Candidatus Thorarchaeota archaeon]
MKETMSNTDIRLILPELKQAAEGSFVKNLYQYGDVFVLRLYKPGGGTSQLLIQVGRRIHLTEFRRVAPRVPPKFCTVLRKYLRDRRIISVFQHDLDRIIVIEIGDESSSHKLVVELFGSGNLLLLDPNDTIFVAMRYRKMRDRSVVPKAQYEFPPPRGVDILGLNMNSFEEIIADSTANVVRTLTSRLNLDALSCEEICALSGVDPRTNVSNLDSQAVKDLAGGLHQFREKFKLGVSEPRVVYSESAEEEEDAIAFLPFMFEIYEGLPTETFASLSQAMDRFFGVSDIELKHDEVQDAYEKERMRLEKIIKKQKENISRLETQANTLRASGEAIYAHFQIVQEILDTISNARANGLSWTEVLARVEKGKEKNIVSASHIEKIVPSQAKITVSLSGVEVGLDIRKSAQDNASLAYEQAKKAESKTKGALRQIEKTKVKLQDLEKSKIEPEVRKVKPVKLRKKRWYEKFRWFISSEGFLVIGGRDAKTNERLAKRQMSPNDVFLHASVHGAPYVIVKVPDRPPGEQTLKEAAQFAVTFSRAWQDGLSSGEAYWVNPEQVSFSPPSGEYLPSGAVMIYGTKNYIESVPVELAVGILLEDDYAIPVSGPPSAITTLTEHHLRVDPGGEKKGQLVKSIVSSLKRTLPEEKFHLVEQIPQEDLMRVLPAGGGKVRSS